MWSWTLNNRWDTYVRRRSQHHLDSSLCSENLSAPKLQLLSLCLTLQQPLHTGSSSKLTVVYLAALYFNLKQPDKVFGGAAIPDSAVPQ